LVLGLLPTIATLRPERSRFATPVRPSAQILRPHLGRALRCQRGSEQQRYDQRGRVSRPQSGIGTDPHDLTSAEHYGGSEQQPHREARAARLEIIDDYEGGLFCAGGGQFPEGADGTLRVE